MLNPERSVGGFDNGVLGFSLQGVISNLEQLKEIMNLTRNGTHVTEHSYIMML